VAPGLDEAAARLVADELAADLDPEAGCAVGVATWLTGESAEQLFERAVRDSVASTATATAIAPEQA
jgi:hypothetical protein